MSGASIWLNSLHIFKVAGSSHWNIVSFEGLNVIERRPVAFVRQNLGHIPERPQLSKVVKHPWEDHFTYTGSPDSQFSSVPAKVAPNIANDELSSQFVQPYVMIYPFENLKPSSKSSKAHRRQKATKAFDRSYFICTVHSKPSSPHPKTADL